MTTRAAVAIAMVAFAPFSLAAQAAPAAGPSTTLASSALTTASRSAVRAQSICDGSELRTARTRAGIGVGLMAASLPVALVGMYRTAHSADHSSRPVAIGVGAGAGLAILGFSVAAMSTPNESFWETALGKMRPGDTSAEEVRMCFERPVAMATTDSTEEWTYLTSRGLSGRVKTVRLTFRDSVLVGIRRAEIDRNLLHDGHGGLVPTALQITDPR